MAKNNKTVDRIQAIWNMIGGDNVVDQIIDGQVKLIIQRVSCITNLIPIRIDGCLNLSTTFFRPGDSKFFVDVSQVFHETFIDEESVCGTSSSGTCFHADLMENAGDQKIRETLPEGHVFRDEKDVLGFLWTLVCCQRAGQEGPLCNSGSPNIFYVEPLCAKTWSISVRWKTDTKQWFFDVNHNVGVWAKGARVFSAAG